MSNREEFSQRTKNAVALRAGQLAKPEAPQSTPDIHGRVLTGLELMIFQVKERVQL
jgi:hypothetical protein